MQYNDDSPKSSRPTLLTPAQQAEADRHRILSQLESGKVGKPTARRTQSKLFWLVSGALLVAIAALLGMWANQNNQADLHLAALSTATDGSIANSATAAAAAAAGTTAASTTATGTAVTTTTSASTAGQVSSNASAAMIQEDHAAQAQDKKQTESEMLDSRSEATGTASTSTSKHDANLLSSALERPTAVVAKPPPQHKTARKEKPKAKPASVAKAPRAKQKQQQKQQQRDPEKSSPEEENDVALLAALVSHIQSEERQAAPPKKPRLSLDEQLSQCKKLSKTKAAQCHARVCDGRSKTGGCRVKK